jgi:hypothetical protein
MTLPPRTPIGECLQLDIRARARTLRTLLARADHMRAVRVAFGLRYPMRAVNPRRLATAYYSSPWRMIASARRRRMIPPRV